jgi:hypothetical protein
MFGDSFFPQDAGLTIVYPGGSGKAASAMLPVLGADRVARIAENGNVLPQDRFYFLYNHFDGLFEAGVRGPGFNVQKGLAVDRYTLGSESPTEDGTSSIELRLPFFGNATFESPSMLTFGDEGVGNLAVILKHLVYSSEHLAASIGLGIDTPTGPGFSANAYGGSLMIQNHAVHLLPFAGLAGDSCDWLFYQAFLQVDVPTNGDRVTYGNSPLGVSDRQEYIEQPLLYADLAGGCWLYRNRDPDKFVTGVASVLELHYTTPLEDSDRLTFGTNSPTYLLMANAANRMDVVNMTAGLHAELSRKTLVRVAGVFPLTSRDNRFFDSQVQVQVEFRQ